jgi:hypothetical protein
MIQTIEETISVEGDSVAECPLLPLLRAPCVVVVAE